MALKKIKAWADKDKQLAAKGELRGMDIVSPGDQLSNYMLEYEEDDDCS